VILLSTVISLTVTALIFAGLAHFLSADEPGPKAKGEV
jgi:hypothetical protein